jgi:hydroxymethylbilane synthase
VFSFSEVLRVGARRSPLSCKQVEEVLLELRSFHPSIAFETFFIDSLGDGDQKTSLRTLDKTDFFTREIDALLLSGGCRIAVHSAKDLPEPLPEGIVLVSLTRGVDPADVLVFRKGGHLETLPREPKIGSSSVRRDEAVKKILPQALFSDIRGTIENRLEQLDSRKYDAVVMAEAALIRLGLCHRDRFRLPGVSAPLQGKLAVVAREHDWEMRQLFSCIHGD